MDIEKSSSYEIIKIGCNVVARFEERCNNSNIKFKNIYYVDTQGVVRKSSQYHSETLGVILIEDLIDNEQKVLNYGNSKEMLKFANCLLIYEKNWNINLYFAKGLN